MRATKGGNARTVLFVLCGVGVVLIGGALVAALAHVESKLSKVECHPTASNGWTFHCHVTAGKGEAKGDETFAAGFVDAVRNQGNDLNRTYRGIRWYASVTVESVEGGTPVQRGREYDMWGTVVSIEGNRVTLTDCVFVERKR